MAVRSIFRSQERTLNTWGRGRSIRHGAGLPCWVESREWCNDHSIAVPTYEWNLRGKRSGDGDRCKKPRRSPFLTVPQTDTGRQVEDTKAFERTLVKELGKLTP